MVDEEIRVVAWRHLWRRRPIERTYEKNGYGSVRRHGYLQHMTPAAHCTGVVGESHVLNVVDTLKLTDAVARSRSVRCNTRTLTCIISAARRVSSDRRAQSRVQATHEPLHPPKRPCSRLSLAQPSACPTHDDCQCSCTMKHSLLASPIALEVPQNRHLCPKWGNHAQRRSGDRCASTSWTDPTSGYRLAHSAV